MGHQGIIKSDFRNYPLFLLKQTESIGSAIISGLPIWDLRGSPMSRVFTTQQEERFMSVKLCCGSVERSLISSSSRSLYFDQEQILQKYFIGFSGITCSNEVKRNWPWNCKIDLDWQPLLYLLSALMKAKWYFNEITTGQVQGDWHVDSQHSLFIRLLAFRYLSIHHTLCKQQWILAPHAFP